jgi:RHS repeat-associated protein
LGSCSRAWFHFPVPGFLTANAAEEAQFRELRIESSAEASGRRGAMELKPNPVVVWPSRLCASPATSRKWFDYAPYGSLLASSNTGTTTVARQYIGQFSDASGLNYLNARYYNGAQGQFLSQDPSRADGLIQTN